MASAPTAERRSARPADRGCRRRPRVAQRVGPSGCGFAAIATRRFPRRRRPALPAAPRFGLAHAAAAARWCRPMSHAQTVARSHAPIAAPGSRLTRPHARPAGCRSPKPASAVGRSCRKAPRVAPHAAHRSRRLSVRSAVRRSNGKWECVQRVGRSGAPSVGSPGRRIRSPPRPDAGGAGSPWPSRARIAGRSS